MENIKYILPSRYAEIILRLSEKISALAQQHEWEEAHLLETKRQLVMQELFSHPDINEALPSIASILHDVMALDAEVIIKGELELQEMATQMNGLSKGKRAVNAYLKS